MPARWAVDMNAAQIITAIGGVALILGCLALIVQTIRASVREHNAREARTDRIGRGKRH